MAGQACPAVFYLAGLTCNEETFAIKAHAQHMAAQLGLILISPDTSPRGEAVAKATIGILDRCRFLYQCDTITVGDTLSNGNFCHRWALSIGIATVPNSDTARWHYGAQYWADMVH